MRENRSQQVFNETAATYDRDRMRLIPGHERFYNSALGLVPSGAKRIVDLGAGSGLFSAILHGSFPKAHLYMIDFSEPMLELAKKRLGESPLLHYVSADYTTSALPEHCDAVVSSLSVHHLDDDRKQALLRPILQALAPGGVFINADHIAGPTPELEVEYQERWLEAVRLEGATEQQIADSLFRQVEDQRTPVATQLAWLREAGFTHVDCWFKDNSFAVMTGRKPST